MVWFAGAPRRTRRFSSEETEAMHHRRPTNLLARGRAALAIPFVSALAAAGTACTGPVETGSAAPLDIGDIEIGDIEALPEADPGPPLPPPPSVGAVCPDTTRVGKMQAPGSSCPQAPDARWEGEQLFGTGVQGPLSQYCLYTWNSSDPLNLGGLPQDAGRLGAVWTSADCMAVTTAAPADIAEAQVQDELKSSFWNAVERPSALPARLTQGLPVRVAIIDSWPSFATAGNSAHGAGMAGIVQNLTCDLIPGECPISLLPHLALNMLEPGVRNNILGGTFGHQSRLAVKIHEAVSAWQSEPVSSNLILNLSIGWDPVFQLGSGGADRPSALAVREAIDEAVCAGALVIASAGNSSFGPTPTTGLAYPAAWSTQIASCGGGRPLVWAVGGVDAKDQLLYNARTGGVPKLTAPGELAYGVPTLSTGTIHAGPFTGTSVSAAVATAAAANVWMYADTLTAAQVMAEVTSTAVPLSIAASACPSPGCGNAQRISICRSAASKAPGGAAAVPCSQHGEAGGVRPVWTPAEAAAIDALAVNHFNGPPLVTLLPTSAPCTKPIYTPFGTTMFIGPSACPLEQYPNAVLAPDIGPQPGPDPCGACSIAATSVGDSRVFVAVSSEMMNNVYLQVLSLYKEGMVQRRYDVGSLVDGAKYARSGFAPGEVYILSVATSGFTDFDAAVIEWVNSPDIQTTSKLVVY